MTPVACRVRLMSQAWWRCSRLWPGILSAGKAMAINSLHPATESDRARFAERQQIAQQRRAARKATATTLPTDESSLLWLFMRQVSYCSI